MGPETLAWCMAASATVLGLVAWIDKPLYAWMVARHAKRTEPLHGWPLTDHEAAVINSLEAQFEDTTP